MEYQLQVELLVLLVALGQADQVARLRLQELQLQVKLQELLVALDLVVQ